MEKWKKRVEPQQQKGAGVPGGMSTTSLAKELNEFWRQ